MKGCESVKKAVALFVALCMLCSVACADLFVPIKPDFFTHMYGIASGIYGVPPIDEMKVNHAVYNTRYWETEHERIDMMLDMDGYIKTVTVTADLSSRVFLNVCFCVLQTMNGPSINKEQKGQIMEYYFMTSQMPDAGWTLNDHVMYQFVIGESENMMNVFVK